MKLKRKCEQDVSTPAACCAFLSPSLPQPARRHAIVSNSIVACSSACARSQTKQRIQNTSVDDLRVDVSSSHRLRSTFLGPRPAFLANSERWLRVCPAIPNINCSSEHSDSSASPVKEKVVVGLSGGVDSSTVAGVLHREGFEVVGVTLWHMTGEGSCCSGGMVDAGRICDQLGVEHHIVDTRDRFTENVVEYVVGGYESGISPLPCSQCNKTVKFKGLIDFAKENGIAKVATGHYVKVEQDTERGRWRLRRAVDRSKDQSYFLYDLSQEQLSYVLFPLDEKTKVKTRQIAKEMGLFTAEKRESQDLCLVEKHGSMQAFLEQHIDPKPGDIVDQEGNVVGRHDGIHNYTIGQRKGLGVAADRPLYVTRIEPETNQVIVCKDRSTALLPETTVQRVNWVSIDKPEGPVRADVQLRYRSPPVPATIVPLAPWMPGESRVRIIFDHPQFGVAPGQAAVFYDGDVVLGGGILERPMVVPSPNSDAHVSSVQSEVAADSGTPSS